MRAFARKQCFRCFLASIARVFWVVIRVVIGVVIGVIFPTLAGNLLKVARIPPVGCSKTAC